MLCLFKINFCGFRRFLININDNSSYVVLYTQCLRYNICSAWFLDMRISTCSNLFSLHTLAYACILQFKLSILLVSLISQPCSVYFNETSAILLSYISSTSFRIYKLKLLLCISLLQNILYIAE